MVQRRTKTIPTLTQDLLALADWLEAQGVSVVAMESTGSFWRPVFNLLEARFEVVLVNARHIKQVPGRKTDVKDSEWIAQLLQRGLLRPSFIPPRTRQRTRLAQEHTAVSIRISKVLEDTSIKLRSVASELLGRSGRAMIEASIRGRSDPYELADLAKRRLRAMIALLRLALQHSVTTHHRFLLRALMDQLAEVEAMIGRFEARIEEALAPFEEAMTRLATIPGGDRRVAQVVLYEISTDMGRFPTSGHLSSWAGVASGNDESAGKRRTGRTPPGNLWLKSILVQAAWAASRKKGSHLSSKFRRIAANLGRRRAAVAVGHAILVVIYHLLEEGTTYREIEGPPTAA